jgi:preprotein translocase subunit SecA
MKKLSAIEIKKETRKLIKRIKESEIFLALDDELLPNILEMVRQISKRKLIT